MTADIASTVCALAFNQLSVGADGKLRICCNAQHPGLRHNGNFIHPSEQADLRYMEEGLGELGEIREALMSGVRHPACQRCWRMEDQGVRSFRVANNGMFPTTHRALLEGRTDFSLEFLSLDFGNKCNLACRMCSPASSSLLAREQALGDGHLLPGEVQTAKSVVERANEKKWYENETFWQSITPRIHEVRRLYLIGGEPLIIDEHVRLLDLIIEHGRPDLVRLEYSSNLTTLGDRFIERWKRFGTVSIAVSMDGVDAAYEYVRWPAKFARVEANLRLLHEARLPNMELSIHPTVQNLTVASLPDLLERFPDTPMFFIPVSRPAYLTPALLPSHVLIRAHERIETWLSMNSDRRARWAVPDLLRTIKGAVDTQIDPELRRQFLKSMAFYDARRKQRLLDVHPYFEEWLDV